MNILLKPILTEGIAQVSYFLGDESAGIAAVVDPRPDVDIYLEMARERSMSITHVFETHIHADFVSGALELVNRLGGAARLYVSEEGGASYEFEHEAVHGGDLFEFGSLLMKACFTPGHTPEHMAYLLYEKDRDKNPFGVLSGDSFFVDSVGRPDLIGGEQTEALSRALFTTIREFYSKLDDGVVIYPGHAAGSSCGPDIGDRMHSTIGYEKRFNPYMQYEEFEPFYEALTQGAPPIPIHYPRLKKVNADGPPVLGNLPDVPALTPAQFTAAIDKGKNQILDTRDMLAFGGGHIEGALNIGMRPELSVWAGWLLHPGKPILLVLEDDKNLPGVLKLLWHTGFVHYTGYLIGGMAKWREAGLPMQHIPQMTVHELKDAGDRVLRLDVRSPDEWDSGHIPGATHHFLGDLQDNLNKLDKKSTIATYCASGFRASMAASLLQTNGFKDVRNVPGSWKAWRSAGLPVDKTNS
jgi:hydroxyacylglutathione hydrolase